MTRAFMSVVPLKRASPQMRAAMQVMQRRSVHGPNPMPYNSEIVHDMLHFKTTGESHIYSFSRINSTGFRIAFHIVAMSL
jgi:hypothetical protein